MAKLKTIFIIHWMLKEFGQILNRKLGTLRQTRETKADITIFPLLERWDDVVGEKLAAISLPQRITGNTLYVVVNHPAYAHHLKSLTHEILSKIRKNFKFHKSGLKDLKFYFSEKAFQEVKRKSLQEVQKKQTPKILHKHNPEYKKLEPAALKAFEHINDEEIKEILVSIYIQNKINLSSNSNNLN